MFAKAIRLPGLHPIFGYLPRNIWRHTKAWVESQKMKGLKGAKYTEISPPDISEQPSPIKINPADPDFYAWNRSWRNFGTFVLEANDLRYESITDSVYTEDGSILYDLSRQFPDVPGGHALLNSCRLPKPTRLPGRTLVLSVRAAGVNYFNWMTLLLPRIKLMDRAGYSFDQFDQILVNRMETGYQLETLVSFGVPIKKCVSSDSQRTWSFEEAVIPSLPYQAGFSRYWALDFIKRRFVKKHDSPLKSSKLIYISRGDATLRRVVNELELEERLHAMGFITVCFDGMKVARQAEIMSEARCVVAPHGAGLTNLMFCPNKIDVVELHAADYYSSSFWWISTRKGNRHAVSVSLPRKDGKPLPKQGICVNVNELVSYLQKCLATEISNKIIE